MAAPYDSGTGATTPRKAYILGNICALCGFSFIQTEQDISGSYKTVKLFDKKLKLNEERRSNIRRVVDVDVLSYDSSSFSAGVCRQ